MAADGQMNNTNLVRGTVVGMLGSVMGMLVMDLVMVVEFSVTGLPAFTYLSLIGSVLGGGVFVGFLLHLLVGAILGAVFSVIVLKVNALRIETGRKGVKLGILAGLLTIPLGCVPFAILIGQPIVKIISFSSIPHLVWGVVLGVVAGFGMRPPIKKRTK